MFLSFLLCNFLWDRSLYCWAFWAEISNHFKVPCSFLDILKVRMSIPLHWRRLLANPSPQPNPRSSDFKIRILGQDLVDASVTGAKAIYKLLNEGKDTVPTAYLKWQEDREEVTITSSEEWRDTCTNPFRASRETNKSYRVFTIRSSTGIFLVVHTCI